MLIHHNYLKLVRKRSRLTQQDLSSLFALADKSHVCRWEKGFRSPRIEELLLYHLLFEVPVEFLFERQQRELRQVLADRIMEHLRFLGTLQSEPKLHDRIAFLQTAHRRLSQSPYE